MPDLRPLLVGVAVVALMAPAEARLTRMVIEKREALAPARPGSVSYELLQGRFEGEVDPTNPHNAIITDLRAAPRNPSGRVTYFATFAIARPVDAASASGVLFYQVPNRGNGRVSADPDGHVRVISGWQGDIPPADGLQTATVPVAVGRRGTPLTGPVLARFVNVGAGTTTMPITAGIGQTVARPLPVSLDTRRATLQREARVGVAPVSLAADQWAFADCSAVPFPGRPDPTRLCLRDGFDRASAYTLVYSGKDPKVLGLGFAATRDLVAFLRHGERDDMGTPNPLARNIRWAVASGVSQAGNFLRSFVHLGFNADEANRIVFDGINPDIAARHVPLNLRFGVPGGAAERYELGSEGTLWWGRYNDRGRARGVTSLLDRCSSSRTCPRIMETFGSSEFWGLRMSPNLVGTDARRDIALPSNVRRYYFPSVTHGGSRVGGFSLDGDKPWPGAPRCTMAMNPNPSEPTMRILTRALIDWVRTGKQPPPSRYPTLAGGDLVAPNARAMGWPIIPGAPVPDGKLNPFLDYDVGPSFRYVDVSGVVSRQPPRIRREIPSLVPTVNADGNETAGIPSVQLLVPLGTYTGWNVLAEGFGAGGGCGFLGGFIPFAKTRAERLARQDPRPSLEERYRDRAGFVDRIRAAAEGQVREGLLLREDAEKLIADAETSNVFER